MARTAIHPGEILAEELAEVAVTPTELARQLRVPANRITQIVHGKRAPATRRYGSAIGSAPVRNSGSICKAPMTFASRKDRQVRRSGGCRNGHSAPCCRAGWRSMCIKRCRYLPPSAIAREGCRGMLATYA